MEGWLPREHLIQHATECVDVSAAVDRCLSGSLFGAHISGGTQRDAGLGDRFGSGNAQGSRDPEVRY